MPPEARSLAANGPSFCCRKRQGTTIAEAVAPRQSDFGVFLPYTPLHHLLFAAGEFSALVMTSGNLSEEPIAIHNQEAVTRLAGIADFFLVHNRDILLRCDDSVVRPGAGRVRQVRRSRGYVPAPLELRGDISSGPCRRRRAQEHDLPGTRQPRIPEPAHWGSRECGEFHFLP